MESRLWSRIKALFPAAVDLTGSARERLLADEETEVRDQVQNLLVAADDAGTFLADPLALFPETEASPEPDRQFAEGELVANRYRVLRYVARGGMGEVYEAEDLELDLVVAVKALRPMALADAEMLSRFKREVELARSVTNEHVGRIYDFGRHRRESGADVAFLTMEFLHGETLADRIRRAGPFTPQEALPIVRDIAAGLTAIHERHIVHRDFKSANVMLVDADGHWRARVMDFGLARPAIVDETLTRTGQVGGTPSYMPPEQFEGVATAASDVYALGVVMHEMLTGSRLKAGSGILPRPWDAVIRKCTATDALDRYQTATGVVDALEGRGGIAAANRMKRGAWFAAAVLALAASGAVWLVRNGRPVQAEPKHVALLPIHSDTGDAADQALCGGLSDTLRGDLTELEGAHDALWVIPSSEVRHIETAGQAYKEVGANLVIEANFHRLADRVELTVELVDARRDRVLRSDKSEASDASAMREKALPMIARMLNMPVPAAAARQIAQSGTSEPGAFDFYEQGIGYLRREGSENQDRAIELFKRALAKDPNYALAYAGLGAAYAQEYDRTKHPDLIRMATENGRKAVGLNQDLEQVHSTLGQIYQLTGRADEAVGEFQTALRIQPGCVACYYYLGAVYEDLARWTDAENSFQEVIRRQPGNWMGYSGLAHLSVLRGNPKRAAELLKHVVELTPDSSNALSNLGAAYIDMGMYSEAIPILQRAIAIRPEALAYTDLGAALMYLKRYPEAVVAMKRAAELVPDDHDYWRNLGDSYRQVPGSEREAEDAYRKALRAVQAALSVKPDDPELVSSAGLYYAHLGQSQQAARYASRAMAMKSAGSEALFTVALAFEIAGFRDNAMKALDMSWKAGYSLVLIESEPELARLQSSSAYKRWSEQAHRVPARN